jgi:hypothetical protein
VATAPSELPTRPRVGGTTRPNIQQRLNWGVVNGWDMDVRVYFARQHPDKKLLAEAQAQLDRLVLPPAH